MTLWLPPGTTRELFDERRAYEQDVLRMMEGHRLLERWTKELKQIDPYLELVRAKESAEGVPGMKPGYYHILRHNPGAPASLEVIETADGGFKEPDSSVFDQLRRSDMWNAEVRRDRERKFERIKLARERQEAREREERRDEMAERFKALENPGVSFAQTGKSWAYRAGARRQG